MCLHLCFGYVEAAEAPFPRQGHCALKLGMDEDALDQATVIY